jgi:hypothetical protein
MKGLDPIQVPDLANYWFNTNEYWPIKKEATCRRYGCFEASDHRIGDQQYFDKLWGSLTSEAAKHFYWYLQSRDIEAWNAKDIPTSEWAVN